MVYIIILCTACSQLLMVRDGQKSRMCPYCGGRVRVSDAAVEGRAATAREARRLLGLLRSKKPAAAHRHRPYSHLEI